MEDVGPDDTAVVSRVIDGVTVSISNSSSFTMGARTYFDDTPNAFNGDERNPNAPLNPGNVSGSRFISTSASGNGGVITQVQPIVFDFSVPVKGFGLTTLDLLEDGSFSSYPVTLEALDSSGTVVDSQTRVGAQGTSGLDLDWFVSSSSANITQVRLLSTDVVKAGGYGIDDLCLTR